VAGVVKLAVEWGEEAVRAQTAQPLFDHTHCRLRVEIGVWVGQLDDVVVMEEGVPHRKATLESNL